MANLKDEALNHLFALQHRYIYPAEVIAWADATILASSSPPSDLIALATTPPEQAAIERALQVLAETFGSAPPKAAALAYMSGVLEKSPDRASVIAYALPHLFPEDTSPAGAEARRVEYAFELAESGAYGTISEATTELRAFLARACEATPPN